MSEMPHFEPPEVTDDDIRWSSRLLALPEHAFHGEDDRDPRRDVLRCMDSIDVAACPGSGKTTLLVAKLAILAQKWQYRTRGMCVLSHTNVARNEIETCLGNTAAGQRLLTYPHFIGTIHAFVNEFLALPWLRSEGYPVKMIDSQICEKRRWSRLHHTWQSALERKRVQSSDIRIVDTRFNWEKKRGQLPSAKDTNTYRNMQKACRDAAKEGYHCYDDMFIWAHDMMDKLRVTKVIRERFPLLFIDEAQDNSEEQSTILHRIFIDGNAAVTRQRFGDANQAVFDSISVKGGTTDEFPDSAVEMAIPNSHRFGQRIADLADPLGLIPYCLKGHGPTKRLASGAKNGPHTIFLFDVNSAGKVMGAYAELLVETFSEKELREGTFTAVGQVHKPPDKEEDHKFPHHVGHYWPDYDPELSTRESKPATFVQYVLAGMRDAELIGEAFPVVEKIAEGILRLAGMAEDGRLFRRHMYRHRYVLQLLEDDALMRDCYGDVVDRFSVRRESPTKEMWNDNRRNVVRKIACTIAGASLAGSEVDDFLAWNDSPNALAPPSASQSSRDNVYRFSADGNDVAIRIGSVHSVKGETHTATLVLETFWNAHNLDKLNQWITGDRKGWKPSDRVQQRDRLKVHYVAMTRPTHLLCLAMKRSTFEDDRGVLDENRVRELKQYGWRVKPI